MLYMFHVLSYAHPRSCALMHYQQYYFMLETHRVTFLNDVISYTIFY